MRHEKEMLVIRAHCLSPMGKMLQFGVRGLNEGPASTATNRTGPDRTGHYGWTRYIIRGGARPAY